MIKSRRSVTKSEIVVFVPYLATLLVVTVTERLINNKFKRLWKNIALA